MYHPVHVATASDAAACKRCEAICKTGRGLYLSCSIQCHQASPLCVVARRVTRCESCIIVVKSKCFANQQACQQLNQTIASLEYKHCEGVGADRAAEA